MQSRLKEQAACSAIPHEKKIKDAELVEVPELEDHKRRKIDQIFSLMYLISSRHAIAGLTGPGPETRRGFHSF